MYLPEQETTSLPFASTDTDDGDGRAVQADIGINTREDNAQEAEENAGETARARGLNTVAALSRAGVALADGRRGRGSSDGNGRRTTATSESWRRCGSRKKRKSDESSGVSELHCEHERVRGE